MDANQNNVVGNNAENGTNDGANAQNGAPHAHHVHNAHHSANQGANNAEEDDGSSESDVENHQGNNNNNNNGANPNTAHCHLNPTTGNWEPHTSFSTHPAQQESSDESTDEESVGNNGVNLYVAHCYFNQALNQWLPLAAPAAPQIAPVHANGHVAQHHTFSIPIYMPVNHHPPPPPASNHQYLSLSLVTHNHGHQNAAGTTTQTAGANPAPPAGPQNTPQNQNQALGTHQHAHINAAQNETSSVDNVGSAARDETSSQISEYEIRQLLAIIDELSSDTAYDESDVEQTLCSQTLPHHGHIVNYSSDDEISFEHIEDVNAVIPHAGAGENLDETHETTAETVSRVANQFVHDSGSSGARADIFSTIQNGIGQRATRVRPRRGRGGTLRAAEPASSNVDSATNGGVVINVNLVDGLRAAFTRGLGDHLNDLINPFEIQTEGDVPAGETDAGYEADEE